MKEQTKQGFIVRLSGLLKIEEDGMTMFIQLKSAKIRKGNPVALPDQKILAVGSYFTANEFDIMKSADVESFEGSDTCGPIREINIGEEYLIGNLKTNDGESLVEGLRVFIEPEDEPQYNQLVKENNKNVVLEGHLVNFTFEDGNEECGLLVIDVNPRS